MLLKTHISIRTYTYLLVRPNSYRKKKEKDANRPTSPLTR